MSIKRDVALATSGVTPAFFDVVPLPIRRGRALSPADGLARAPVTVVSALAAETFWPGRDPIGETLSIDGRGGTHHALQVVGVVPRARFSELGSRERLVIYLPYEFVASSLAKTVPLATTVSMMSGVSGVKQEEETSACCRTSDARRVVCRRDRDDLRGDPVGLRPGLPIR